jgi:hypothetical protein
MNYNVINVEQTNHEQNDENVQSPITNFEQLVISVTE